MPITNLPLTIPSKTPITLNEVKFFLNIVLQDEDQYLSNLIGTAVQLAEETMRLRFIEQTWMLTYYKYVPKSLYFSESPVRSIEKVEKVDSQKITTPIPSTDYTFYKGKDRLTFKTCHIAETINITYKVGFGPTPNDTPIALRHALLAHVAHLYATSAESLLFPPRVNQIYNQHRRYRMLI